MDGGLRDGDLGCFPLGRAEAVGHNFLQPHGSEQVAGPLFGFELGVPILGRDAVFDLSFGDAVVSVDPGKLFH